MSFQPASENRQWCGGSDVLWKLVPGRNGSDDESEVTNRRTSCSRMINGDVAERTCSRPSTSTTRRTYPGAVTLMHRNIIVASLKVIQSGTRIQWSWRKSIHWDCPSDSFRQTLKSHLFGNSFELIGAIHINLSIYLSVGWAIWSPKT